MSCGVFINWIANFAVALTFLTLLDTFGATPTFWLYAVISVVTLLFILRYIPETKNKTLEEIEASWL